MMSLSCSRVAKINTDAKPFDKQFLDIKNVVEGFISKNTKILPYLAFIADNKGAIETKAKGLIKKPGFVNKKLYEKWEQLTEEEKKSYDDYAGDLGKRSSVIMEYFGFLTEIYVMAEEKTELIVHASDNAIEANLLDEIEGCNS